MDVGIPVERNPYEYRVGITPQGVKLLTQAGHRCYVEHNAGEGASFSDLDYERAGARIVYHPQEIYERADLLCKFGSPTLEELQMAREQQTICAFWHLATRPREVYTLLAEKRITALAYEMIRADDGSLPVLHPLSEIAGRMAPQIAARWLQNDGGGSGMLISGIAGIPPIDVVIIGAGTVGVNAARAFNGLGARVFLLDRNLDRLKAIEDRFSGQVVTMVAYDFNIARVLRFADVVIGAVLVPGERTPIVITREMIQGMRARSVFIDMSIDQGGCSETSRPTTHKNPTYVEENIIHYCVPNIPGVVARTATHAFLNAAWPYTQMIATDGVLPALEANAGLRSGVMVREGEVTDPRLARLVLETI